MFETSIMWSKRLLLLGLLLGGSTSVFADESNAAVSVAEEPPAEDAQRDEGIRGHYSCRHGHFRLFQDTNGNYVGNGSIASAGGTITVRLKYADEDVSIGGSDCGLYQLRNPVLYQDHWLRWLAFERQAAQGHYHIYYAWHRGDWHPLCHDANFWPFIADE